MLIFSQSEHQSTVQNTVTVAVIQQPHHKLLLLQRNPDAYPNAIDPFPYAWELIGGHVEEEEEPQTAAHREIVEETGLVFSQLELVGISPFRSRNVPASNWIYVAFVEREMPIVVSQEHLGYTWQTLADALRMRLAFKHSHILEALIQVKMAVPESNPCYIPI